MLRPTRSFHATLLSLESRRSPKGGGSCPDAIAQAADGTAAVSTGGTPEAFAARSAVGQGTMPRHAHATFANDLGPSGRPAS